MRIEQHPKLEAALRSYRWACRGAIAFVALAVAGLSALGTPLTTTPWVLAPLILGPALAWLTRNRVEPRVEPKDLAGTVERLLYFRLAMATVAMAWGMCGFAIAHSVLPLWVGAALSLITVYWFAYPRDGVVEQLVARLTSTESSTR